MCDAEVIRMQDMNTAYERMLKGDVRYRFVIDMASLQYVLCLIQYSHKQIQPAYTKSLLV